MRLRRNNSHDNAKRITLRCQPPPDDKNLSRRCVDLSQELVPKQFVLFGFAAWQQHTHFQMFERDGPVQKATKAWPNQTNQIYTLYSIGRCQDEPATIRLTSLHDISRYPRVAQHCSPFAVNWPIASTVRHMIDIALLWATNDSCGVRTYALADWRLKPAP